MEKKISTTSPDQVNAVTDDVSEGHRTSPSDDLALVLLKTANDSELAERHQELDDGDIDVLMECLRLKFPRIAGLQFTGCGQYKPGSSMPMFKPVEKRRFVQILNIGDHWICVTNMFGSAVHNIFVFDGLHPKVLSRSTIVQVSSLLRQTTTPNDSLTFYMRRFHPQALGSRLCGFLEVAATYACCNGIDPTGNEYDEDELTLAVTRRLQVHDSSNIVPVGQNADPNKDIAKIVSAKLYCICQEGWGGISMISCSTCKNWLHVDCVSASPRVLWSLYRRWNGPCCKVAIEEVISLSRWAIVLSLICGHNMLVTFVHVFVSTADCSVRQGAAFNEIYFTLV